MRKTTNMMIATGLLMAGSGVHSEIVAERLTAYQAEGAGPFDAARGAEMWIHNHTDGKTGQPRSCASCHTDNLTSSGKHARTGKEIAPMAPSVNPQRLTDIKEIEKWFSRNCKWTLGRECTPQEKGDFLVYLRLQ